MPKNKVRAEPVIPDHEVLRQIGGGAYGEVWLARGVTGAMRAVKVVYRDDFDDEREFEREFQGILKYEPISRDHPALVHILHVGRSKGEETFYYYVMELGDDVLLGREINPVEYEPRTVRSDLKVADGMPLDTNFCITAGRSLSEGLQHLHGNGLAHRDVKPANIIFVDGKAKLADIGLVALRGQRTFVGTEGFVPPEGPGSAQADVYSLGKVLYEMATGKDRMEFPELPDELPTGEELKRWRMLNSVICDICEPRISHRRINTAEMLAEEFARLEQGLRRKVEVSPILILSILCLAIVLTGGWNFATMDSWVLRSGGNEGVPFTPPPTELGLVTVTARQTGAEVYSEEGEFLGLTPLRPREMPVGTWVSFEFRLRGYQSATAGGVVSKEGLVIEPELKIYAPPQRGENWQDVVGMSYRWERDSHVSHYYVGRHEWNQYLKDTKRKEGRFVSLSENGRQREVVLAKLEEAEGFVQWLMEKCRDGYLNVDQIIQPRLDTQRDMSMQFPDGVPEGVYPFRCVVLPGARILLTSEPIAANVSINGVLRGRTPLVEENGQVGVAVAPGKVVVSLQADGFKTLEKIFLLEPDEKWEVPEHLVMERNMGVVFGRPWKNSLGMKFAPFGDDLMVSVWETRVSDYAEYVKDQKVKPPKAPSFKQEGDHPVVNLSRDEAKAFCVWLTDWDRKRDYISKNHEYRLPSDLEWSALAGLAVEIGDNPQKRDQQEMEGFPWGAGWPPPEGTANLADESAEDLVPDLTIQGYEDGFPWTAPVGSFPANGFGFFDVSGNASEWVADDYLKEKDTHGVVRGGSWEDYRADLLSTSKRLATRPTDRNEGTGFRVVLAKVPPKKENPPVEPVEPVAPTEEP